MLSICKPRLGQQRFELRGPQLAALRLAIVEPRVSAGDDGDVDQVLRREIADLEVTLAAVGDAAQHARQRDLHERHRQTREDEDDETAAAPATRTSGVSAAHTYHSVAAIVSV